MTMSKKLIADLQLAIEHNGKLLRELKAQQRVYIARDFNMKPQHVFIGIHACNESPTRTHVFDLKADDDKDLCLYCKGQ
jgi:hypothetical protein